MKLNVRTKMRVKFLTDKFKMQLIFWDCRLLSWATTASALTGIAFCRIGFEYPFAKLFTNLCFYLTQQQSNQVKQASILLAEVKKEYEQLKLNSKQLNR